MIKSSNAECLKAAVAIDGTYAGYIFDSRADILDCTLLYKLGVDRLGSDRRSPDRHIQFADGYNSRFRGCDLTCANLQNRPGKRGGTRAPARARREGRRR